MSYVQPYRNPSNKTWATNVETLKKLFEKWGVDMADYQLDCDVQPQSRNARTYTGTEVRLRYRHPKSKNVVEMKLGTQDTAARNLNSIVTTLEDIYMQERRGLAGIASAHYLALDAPKQKPDPYIILGVRPDASLDDIEDMYRIKAKRLHPDTGANGGDPAKFAELTEAYEDAKGRIS